MVPSDYKSAHVAFVSDQTGSTLTHINLISFISLTSLSLYSVLRTRVPNFPPKHPLALFIVQFVFIVLPLLLLQTYAAHGSGWLALSWNILLSSLTTIVWSWFEAKSQRLRETLPNLSPNPSKAAFPNEKELKERLEKYKRQQQERKDGIAKLPAVTTWRAHMMLMTVIAILAVDFRVFPRSLAKCETFGVSLMDLGVGSFVFAQGVASALPLLRDPKHLSGNIVPKVVRSIKKTSPLIFLGLVRLLAVKSTDYPGEHVSEYGTHWNFFLTLAVVPTLQMTLHPVFQVLPIWLVGLLITFVHQACLSWTALQDWTLHAPRTDIVSHNKEGIVSTPGYLAIHLLGLFTGILILPSTPSHFRRTAAKGSKDDTVSSSDDEAYVKDAWVDESKNSVDKQRDKKKPEQRDDGKTAIELCSYGVLYGILFLGTKLTAFGGDVSRRLANLQYVLWVATFNILFLLLYIVHDMVFYPSPARKPRATDTAAQLGPTAPPVTGNNEDDIWASTTALALPTTSGATFAVDYMKRPSFETRHSASSCRPSSRQGFLTVEDGLSSAEDTAGGQSKKKLARRSWDGSDLRLGRGNAKENEQSMEGYGQDRSLHPGGDVFDSDSEVVKRTSPELLDAINKNGLVVFLLANLLTGVINLSVETIYASDGAAMSILAIYLIAICGFAWVFRARRLLAL